MKPTEASTSGAADGHARFTGVVAMDGPSGTGKSTVARALARRLGARYLDTGAMYRAATVAVLRHDGDMAAGADLARIVAAARIDVSTDPDAPGILLDGDAVDREIRTPEVTAAVSAVSAVAEIRSQLVALQRALIGIGGIVVEGRDIGTVVWPQAAPKVYLTASAQMRARRRAGELGAGAQLASVAADIDRRDRLDSSRAVSPLTRAVDAIEVDTTYLDIDEVVDRLVDLAMQAADGA